MLTVRCVPGTAPWPKPMVRTGRPVTVLFCRSVVKAELMAWAGKETEQLFVYNGCCLRGAAPDTGIFMTESQLLLGKDTSYSDEYNPSVLFPIARAQGRSDFTPAAFTGYDLWRIYELTWLNPQGLPQCHMATLKVNCQSPFIIESKSLKLYLGSFSQTVFASENEVRDIIVRDLNEILQTEVEVKILPLSARAMPVMNFDHPLLEHEAGIEEMRFKNFEVTPDLLRLMDNGPRIAESLNTNIFRSRCPVTGQPDYASLEISYVGKKIHHGSLLAYLISYRRHQGFHEQCVERIFTDICNLLKPDELTVTACFTRRGGIDISPVRSNARVYDAPVRTSRQ